MKLTKLFFIAALSAVPLVWSVESPAQAILDQEQAARTLAIRKLDATASQVSGEVVNMTPHTVREIELWVQYHWLWKNEFKPGSEPPGRTDVVRINQEIAPGRSATFRHTPNPPLPARQDGWFEPEITVAGFTSVIPADMTSR
jgi:hypothetical protein